MGTEPVGEAHPLQVFRATTLPSGAFVLVYNHPRFETTWLVQARSFGVDS